VKAGKFTPTEYLFRKRYGITNARETKHQAFSWYYLEVAKKVGYRRKSSPKSCNGLLVLALLDRSMSRFQERVLCHQTCRSY